ncbi:MAG: DNA-binding transcriptional repressor AcrR [Methanobacterium sp. PtaU1.Bin242]|nr:MAG: DNA-binding transcriptional repressor AcrR [Methanobacterium sp. PtaU1.Bin242]
MPKTFTVKEKEFIRNTLIKRGRELFSIYGLRKTSISQLTTAAGIAQGTFYTFFGSKEELYFDILEIEETKIEKQFVNDILNSSHSAKEAIRKIIKSTYELLENNPFLVRIYDSKDYELMVRKLPPEKLETHRINDTIRFLDIVKGVQQKDELITARPEVIAGLLRGIIFSFLHKDEIGQEIYPEVVDLMANVIADGLVKKNEKTE